MFQLILGRAGSGKTRWIRQMLQEKVQQDAGPLFLLVPEQFSFESERSMLRRLGPADARRVEVVSFTRLADTVMRAYGGLAGRRLDDCGRSVFMSMALEECADQLFFYRRRGAEADFVQLMLGAVTEFKMSGISPDDTARTAKNMTDGTLSRKLEELSLVYGAYEALVAQSYVDPLDDLKRLEGLLRQHRFFDGATVAIDSFKGFTAQEMRVLEHILGQAKEVYATLCADELQDREHGLGLFSPVCKTAGRLIRAAKKGGAQVKSPIVLEHPYRFQTDELRLLEEGLFRNHRLKYNKTPEHVHLYASPNKYGEAEFAARSIRRLVREKGYRYRDIAVIVRSENDYRGIADTLLQSYGIPCFMDVREPVDHKPLMCFVLAGIETVVSGFSTDALFRCLKTGLAGIATEEISLLENYAFLWGINGKRWRSPFTMNPDGFTEGFSDEQRRRLERLNQLRKRIVCPLEKLEEQAKDGTGLSISRAVFQFLEDMKAASHLKEAARQMKGFGLDTMAEEQLRLWDILIQLLDQMAAVLGEHRLELSRYGALLLLAIRAAEIAYIPQTLDEVVIGGADRMRTASPRAVFVLGANQGIFPAVSANGGVFTEGERRLLEQAGWELAAPAEEQAVEELFLAYTAMTSSSERLYVTYAKSDGTGEGMTPSRIVTELLGIFPHLREETPPPQMDVGLLEAEAQAFEALAADWQGQTALVSSLFAYFKNRPEYRPSLEALQRAAQSQPAAFTIKKRQLRCLEKICLFPPPGWSSITNARFSISAGTGCGPNSADRLKSTRWNTAR